MNQLELRYETDDAEGITLRPFVDGEDLLLSTHNEVGMDPHDLLPPLSSALLPTALGRNAVVGRCGCGEVGCGSFALSVRREGDDVLWEPMSDPLHETLSHTYRFGLRPYLDAIDTAAASPPGEGRGRRAVRAVRVARERYAEKYGRDPDERIDWVAAWPWNGDAVAASVTRAGRQQVYEFEPRVNESELDYAARIVKELDRLRFC